MIRSRLSLQASRAVSAVALLVAASLLSACEGGLAGGLRSIGVGGAPDEFLVLPTKPLEMPQDLAALPPPALGAANRVDRQPRAEAVAALTGGRTAPAGTASAPALVARAGAVDPQIRARVAREDAVWREENQGRLLERLAGTSTDAVVYEDQRLDANAEFLRLRAAGLRVPAAPPLGVQ